MRRRPRDAKVEYRVAKNTLHQARAARGRAWRRSTRYLEGPTGIAFGTDEVSAAKILSDFAKEFEKAGLEGGICGRPRVRTGRNQEAGPASLPRGAAGPVHRRTSRSPMQGVVGVLSGSLRQMVAA